MEPRRKQIKEVAKGCGLSVLFFLVIIGCIVGFVVGLLGLLGGML